MQGAKVLVTGATGNVGSFLIDALSKRGAIPVAAVRPGFFMQNFTTTHLQEIRDEKRLFIPAKGGITGLVDARDVAECIAETFFHERHLDKAYEVTGARNWSFAGVAERLSEILDERIRYESPAPLAFIKYHMSRGKSLGFCLVMLYLYSTIRFGNGGSATDTVESIFKIVSKSLDDFIHDHAHVLTGKDG